MHGIAKIDIYGETLQKLRQIAQGVRLRCRWCVYMPDSTKCATGRFWGIVEGVANRGRAVRVCLTSSGVALWGEISRAVACLRFAWGVGLGVWSVCALWGLLLALARGLALGWAWSRGRLGEPVGVGFRPCRCSDRGERDRGRWAMWRDQERVREGAHIPKANKGRDAEKLAQEGARRTRGRGCPTPMRRGG